MTIYALSSGPGVSGIAVIRISGVDTSKAIELMTGKKPPDEINEKARFRESKLLTLKILRIIKISKVKPEYKKKIFIACLNTSELSKEIKLVKVFLKLSS